MEGGAACCVEGGGGVEGGAEGGVGGGEGGKRGVEGVARGAHHRLRPIIDSTVSNSNINKREGEREVVVFVVAFRCASLEQK